ncbi:MAG: hypothetical protein QOJ50_2617 [Cryptosporangiaceae bacterium]|nr:hypothetical protein [Cryptosporangiaceae bacterium]
MPSQDHSRLRRVIVASAAGASLVAGMALVASTQSANAAEPAGLERVGVRESLLATYTWYRQVQDGHPVLNSFYVERKDRKTGAVTVEDGRAKITGLVKPLAAVAKNTALATAAKKAPGATTASELVVVPGATAKLAWSVNTTSNKGTVRTLVDASSGAVLESKSLVQKVTGTGTVFEGSNPVTNLQDETLTDQNDTNYAKLANAYKTVPLTNLNGDNTLRGKFAYDANPSPTKGTNNVWKFNRSQGGFEETMAYHAINSAQEYIQSLGFTNVNNEAQDFTTVGLADDNSFYDPGADKITFGTGGVDDAEDREVIWHELGHAIQDAEVPGFGASAEAGSMGEGFGDYWGMTMALPISKNTAKTPAACLMDWDSTAYTTTVPHCIRRLDTAKKYPGDMQGEVHADGEIWSHALFDFHNAVGRDLANKIILEATFGYAPNTTFKAAATKTVATAQTLGGATAAAAAKKAFTDRGILP